MTGTYDFIIIGGGIAGASAACFLSPHGRTLVLEKEEFPGYHTTGRSAAFFAETYGNAVVQKFTRASKDFLLSPPDGFSETPLVKVRGAIYIATEDQEEFLASSYLAKKNISPEIRKLSASEIAEKLPCLHDGYAVAGYEDPGCRDIDVHALHQGYLKGMKAAGGEILCNRNITGIERTTDGWLLETAEGRIEGRILINAAGAWGDVVAEVVGVAPVGLEPRRRTVVCVDADGAELVPDMPLVLDAKDEFYFKPEGDAILLTPCDETPMPPCDVQPEELDIARAIDRLEKASRFNVNHVRRKWSGLRTFAEDRSPVIGFDPDVDGFFWCVGQGGFGIQTSPAIGRLVRDLIMTGEGDRTLPIAEVSPGRFRG